MRPRPRPVQLSSGAALWLALAPFLLVSTTARAQAVACVKNVGVDLLHNGVVAPGAATAGCAVGPVWTQVAPVEMQSPGAYPDGFLYLAFRTSTNRLLVGVDVGHDDDLSDKDSVALLFDADNSKSPNPTAGDFVIRVQAVPVNPNPITNGVSCTQAAGVIDYFQWDGEAWQKATGADQTAISAAVLANVAYRYPGGMNVMNVWNMELDLPQALKVGGKTFFDFKTAGFGLAAYFYVDKNHQTLQTGTVLRWPASLVAHDISDPVVDVVINPSHEPNWSTFAGVSLGDVCFNVNFSSVSTPWAINPKSPAQSNDHRIDRNGPNTLRVTYYFDGPGDDPKFKINNGTVRLKLVPYAAGFNHANALDRSLPSTATQFNSTVYEDFTFSRPYPPDWDTLEANHGPIQFVCATMSLEGFDFDEDTTDNSKNVNFNYFSTSTYDQSFFLSGGDIPNLGNVDRGNLYLRLASLNDPQGGAPVTGGGGVVVGVWGWVSWCLAALLAVALLVLVFGGKAWPGGVFARVLVFVLLVLALVFGGLNCRRRGGTIGTSRWQVTNAGELGLRPVKGDPTLFSMPVAKGEARSVSLHFTGRPLPYKTERRVLTPADEEGEPNVLKFPVTPGRVVTVLAFGVVDLDGQGPLPPTSATGMTVPEIENSRRRFLLSEGFYVPRQHAGALIGSFDGFRNSFVIGRANSIVVPTGSDTLSVAINWDLQRYREIVGTLEVVVVGTLLDPVPTHTIYNGDATGHVPPMLNIWEALVSLNVSSYYLTRLQDPGGPVRSETLHAISSAHFSIYDSHAQ